MLRSKSSFQQDLELFYPREELTVDLTFVSVDVFHDLFIYRWWWQFEGFEAGEETQNAFSDSLGVVCPFLSLILENLVGLKSSCNKEPVIFSWGGSQGFWREDGFQWGTEWGSVVANRV